MRYISMVNCLLQDEILSDLDGILGAFQISPGVEQQHRPRTSPTLRHLGEALLWFGLLDCDCGCPVVIV
jgi:hypothetical protein